MRSSPSPDYTSFSAYRASQLRNKQGVFPESELRQLFVANPDGTMGRYKASTGIIGDAIGAGQKKRDYSKITVPVLAFFEFSLPADTPPRPDEYQPQNEEERAAISAFRGATKAYIDRWVMNLKRSVPDARLVDLPGAGHYVFLTREADVVRELKALVADLR